MIVPRIDKLEYVKEAYVIIDITVTFSCLRSSWFLTTQDQDVLFSFGEPYAATENENIPLSLGEDTYGYRTRGTQSDIDEIDKCPKPTSTPPSTTSHGRAPDKCDVANLLIVHFQTDDLSLKAITRKSIISMFESTWSR